MNAILLYFLGFLFNLVITLLITRYIYYPTNHNKTNIFTFIAFNTVTFFVVSILTSVELSIGIGFGLFALFSILRYRTDTFPIRDMTYLFITLALAVMNAIMFNGALYEKLIISNVCILAIIYFLEKGHCFQYEQEQKIRYEKIDMIKPEKHDLLLKDLEERTGKKITRFEIGEVDFLKDTAEIIIHFKEARKTKK
jgi:hypothetical protein